MSADLSHINVDVLKGVGKVMKQKLASIGIETLQDVLFHLPFRYEDRTSVTKIGAARSGASYVFEGEVIACDIAYGRRRSLLAYLQDSTGRVGLRFYHFSKSQHHNLKNIGRIRCFGELRDGASGPEIYHPEYSKVDISEELEKSLTPVYPTTEGISQSRYRSLTTQALALLKSAPLDNLISDNSDYDINSAIQFLHKPPSHADKNALLEGKHPAQGRLAFEELVAHQLSLKIVRAEFQKLIAIALDRPGQAYRDLITNFEFLLTDAQTRVANEIAEDLTRPIPTLRLIQGDVGSGKTVIAVLAATHACENKLQTAIMAPTELLAEQHYMNFTNWLSPINIKTAWLSSRVTGKRRNAELERIRAGEAEVIIGTHALFQNDVEFNNLGLVIIDEQHRFGVHQRLALREKGVSRDTSPHQLVMTATPIPRTLSMSVYADLDVSVIDELPPGRKPVTTTIVPDERRNSVIKRVADACSKGRQVYWVCTLIEESETLQCQAAEVTAQQLSKLIPNAKVGLVHGRMNQASKTNVMNDFKARNLELLVATTVIEVGVDVPNASLMIIENSERLGLAQLHQLRGRVGRGNEESHCVLIYKKPLSKHAKERLDVMRQSNDGFFIAEKDLEIRGPGELLGARQSGTVNFRIADLLRDQKMLPEVRETSMQMVLTDRSGCDNLVNRWIKDPERIGQA